ncbi:MAG: lipopolysaccharide heptosyltransferase I [Nitrospirae bacterium]|nr:lipopolysaccharide heptosyltransferase I [Nitrospirota bacterium]
MKILIVKPSSLGDIVHALPFLNTLSVNYPGAEIHWVVARAFHELLEGHPMIKRLWVVDKDRWKRLASIKSTLDEFRRLKDGLRQERFDIVVDLQGLLRSGIITALSGCATRIGFKEAREGSRFFYNQLVEGGRGLHAVDRYLRVATSVLNCKVQSVEFPLPMSDVAANLLGGLRDFAVIVPGARWKTKQWEAKKFGQLAALLPLPSVVIGSVGDIEIARAVTAYSKQTALNLAGRTSFKELIGIIKKARFMITNDTGPMHIAAALNVPVFGVFGPTDPALTGPYGSSCSVIRAGIDCSPCFKKNCRTKKCMRDLSFQSIYETISQSPVLDGRGWGTTDI